MIQTLLYALYWWGILLVISVVFIPLVKHFFAKSFDSGWIAAKVIGLLILTYIAYILGIFKLVTFSSAELWIILIILFFLNRVFGWRKKSNSESVIVIDTRIVVIELIFLIFLILMSIVRGYQPEIYGLEKYMDFGFVQSALEGRHFPPKDLWWAGGTINYYYFGHLWVAVLIKLSGVPSAVGYNLAMAAIFALSTTLIVVIIRTWTKKLWFGILGAFLHSGIGNLHFITTIFKKGWNEYWYPDASRLIPGVITEFPVYSYVVYDLHAHVINIPVAILMIGFIGQIFINRTLRFYDSILIGFLLGVCFMANTWDLPIYLLLSGIVLIFFAWKNVRSKKSLIILSEKIALVLIVIAATILPFWVYFDKTDTPILPTDFHSPIYMMFQLWGFWLILAVSFVIFLILNRKSIKYFDWFAVSLYFTAIILLIIPEFVYVKDIYGQDHQRANTVFKLTYQSWNIFALAGTYTISRILLKKTNGLGKFTKVSWGLIISLLIAACGAYTVKAYLTGYGEFNNFYGINGEKHINTIYGSEEKNALEWVKNNTNSEDVVLEASGDSYTDYQRVSVFTGRPTVVGWAVHEWLWRGSFDPVGRRQNEVERIYSSNDIEEVKTLLTKYNVKYIYFGGLELQKYPSSPGLGIKTLSKEVFKNSGVTIFEVAI